MHKKEISFFIGVLIVLFSLNFVLATDCNLKPSIINQDPDPVQSGEFVEIVFQLSGTDNPDCKGARFEVVPEYPFSLANPEKAKRELEGDTYVRDFKRTWNIPYKLKVDEKALEGEHPLKVKFAPGTNSDDVSITEEFDISVEDLRVDFEVSARSYDIQTKELTFEILNTGKHDIKALTIDVPEQDNLNIQGSPRTIVGYLDSGEETTFDFDAVPEKGDIDLQINYMDENDERHTLEKTVYYNPEYFEAGQSVDKGFSVWFYLFIALLALVGFRLYWNKRKQKKKK